MWRPGARRALFFRRAAGSRPAVLHNQVPNHETVTTTLPSIESVSRFPIFSKTYHVHQHPRFFSSNPAETYEDPPPEPRISEGNEGFEFGALNVLDGHAKTEIENEDSIFDDADNLEANKGFSEKFGDSVDVDENVGFGSIDDESGGEVKTNDAEKVESLLSLLQSSGTVEGSIEPHLEEMSLVLDEGLVLKALETPHVPGENLIGFFRWILTKPEFSVTTRVLDSLVSVICLGDRKREAYALWDLISEVGEKEKGVVSSENLNDLIAVFSRLGKGKAAFDVFNKFEEFGCHLNADTYYNTIEVLCKRSFYNWACSVCEKMLNADKLPDTEKVGKIISYLCKGGMTKDAYLVYLYAKDKKIYPPRSSVNFLISSLARIERADKGTSKGIDKELDKETVSLALGMLNDYSKEDRKYAIKSFSSVIKKLCWIEDVDRAKKLLLEMIDAGPPPGNDIFNCVINRLSKSGDMKEALNILTMMKDRGLKPDVYTYSVIMSGYARSGEMEEACKIFDEAKQKHSKLTPVTYHTLIRGFCKLEQFDKAVDLLGEMKQYKVLPCHDEYNKLIKSLCFKGLDWETAEKLEVDMRENGVILNGRTRALIRAVKELKEGVGNQISGPA